MDQEMAMVMLCDLLDGVECEASRYDRHTLLNLYGKNGIDEDMLRDAWMDHEYGTPEPYSRSM